METETKPRHRADRDSHYSQASCTATRRNRDGLPLHDRSCPRCFPITYAEDNHATHKQVPLCVGCFNPMPADPRADDHSVGCPTGANGTPYYE